VQTAVLIELLLHVPIRMANLQGLRIGIQLLRGPKDRMAISVPAHEVKNDVGIEGSLSGETAKLLALYIDHYRPLLVKEESDYLFPGERPDSPKTYESLRSQIEKVLAQRIGIRFNPHSFRHLHHAEAQSRRTWSGAARAGAQVVAFDDVVLLRSGDARRAGGLR
jgi:integrase